MDSASIDIHELLKRQVYNEKITPHSRNNANANRNYMHFEQNRPYSDQTFGVSDNYLVLDSFIKSPDSNLSRGEISWNVQIQGSTNLDQNIIGSNKLLDTVIEIELGKFTLPILKEISYPKLTLNIGQYIQLEQNNSIPENSKNLSPVLQPQQIPQEAPSSLPTTIPPNAIPWSTNPFTQTPFGGIITIQLKEAGVQSYCGINTLHHFMYRIQYNTITTGTSPEATNAIPMFEGANLFIFTEPIIQFNSISLVFRNPDIPIHFEPDIINCKIVCDFTKKIGNKYFLTFYYDDHNLLTEDRIYIKKFNSGIEQLDSYINSQNGLLVGYPPDCNGMSQNKETMTVIDNCNFYLDPFITFTERFKHGELTNFKINFNECHNNFTIQANIIFSFGQCIIIDTCNTSTENNYCNASDESEGESEDCNTSDCNLSENEFLIYIKKPFKIGIFSGEYSYCVKNTYETDSIQCKDLYITNIQCCLHKLQTYTDVYIAKRRLIIPIRLRSIVNKVTNYITPT